MLNPESKQSQAVTPSALCSPNIPKMDDGLAAFKHIPLTRGKFAIVDIEDYERVSNHKWHLHYGNHPNLWYARSGDHNFLMHRLILGVKRDQQIDHINGNGLDNRRSNLRICNNIQNQQNRRITKNTTSVYKGVYWHTKAKKWCVQLQYNKKWIYLGLFRNEINAAEAYDKKALELFGEFAKPNFV